MSGRRSKKSEKQRHTNDGCRNDRKRRLNWREHGSLQVFVRQNVRTVLCMFVLYSCKYTY
jgi:hypothetical protein